MGSVFFRSNSKRANYFHKYIRNASSGLDTSDKESGCCLIKPSNEDRELQMGIALKGMNRPQWQDREVGGLFIQVVRGGLSRQATFTTDFLIYFPRQAL